MIGKELVIRGEILKDWYTAKKEIRQIRTVKKERFSILDSLDDINDNRYYIIVEQDNTYVVIKEVEFANEKETISSWFELEAN